MRLIPKALGVGELLGMFYAERRRYQIEKRVIEPSASDWAGDCRYSNSIKNQIKPLLLYSIKYK